MFRDRMFGSISYFSFVYCRRVASDVFGIWLTGTSTPMFGKNMMFPVGFPSNQPIECNLSCRNTPHKLMLQRSVIRCF